MEAPARHLLLNRLTLCLCAICALWLTSMQICFFIVESYVQSPSFEQVTTSCKFAYDITLEMREDYSKCVRDEVIVCRGGLDSVLHSEEDRVAAIARENQGVTDLALSSQMSCSQSLHGITTALNSYMHAGPSTRQIIFDDACSVEDRQSSTSIISPGGVYVVPSKDLATTEVLDYSTRTKRFLSQLTLDLHALENNYTSALAVQKSLMLSTASSTMASTQNAVATEVNTTIAELQSRLNEVLACVGPSAPGECTSGPSLYDLYAAQKAFIDAQQQSVAATQLELASTIAQYEDQVAGIAQTFTAFYASIAGPNGLISQFSNAVGQLGVSVNTCDLTNPSWCSLSPDYWAITAPSLQFAVLQSIPSPSAVWQTFTAETLPAAQAAMVASSTALVIKLEAIQSDALNSVAVAVADTPLAGISKDAIDQRVAAQSELLDEFQQNMTKTASTASALTQLNSSSVASEGTNSSATFAATFVSASTFLLSFTSFSKEYLSLSFSAFLDSFSSVRGMLFLLDYIYRAVQSVLLILKFWSHSVVQLPSIDLRSDVSKEKANFLVTHSSSIAAIGHVWSYTGFIIACSVIVAIGIAEVYTQFYFSYAHACVSHSTNETYVSSVLSPLAFNLAASSGNSLLVDSMSVYNGNASSVCSRYQAQYGDSYGTCFDSISKARASFVSDSKDFLLLERCVNSTAMDLAFTAACSSDATANACPTNTSSGLQYHLPSEYFSDVSCSSPPEYFNAQSSMLETSAFNCSVLPLCSVFCNGPDQEKLADIARQCSCMGEWFVHSKVFGTGLAAIVYILLYISTKMVLEGVLMMEWRHLRPEVFEYQASCDLKGDHLTTDPTNDVNIKNKFHWQLKAYEFKGMMYILVGALVNLLWVVLLIYATNSIAYTPYI